MTRSRYCIFEDFRPHFCICTIVRWLPIFTRPEAVQIVLDSWKFLIEHNRMTIYGYVVMENHCTSSPPRTAALARKSETSSHLLPERIIDRLNELGARHLLDQLAWHKARHKTDRDYQLWQEGSHPEEISCDQVMWQKLEYTHSNPTRRGYIDDPLQWHYSSARNYAGMPGLLSVVTDWR
ncbi:MAG TPA: transposase [Pirellulaceae bacterium]|jgi:hypothetical protein